MKEMLSHPRPSERTLLGILRVVVINNPPVVRFSMRSCFNSGYTGTQQSVTSCRIILATFPAQCKFTSGEIRGRETKRIPSSDEGRAHHGSCLMRVIISAEVRVYTRDIASRQNAREIRISRTIWPVVRQYDDRMNNGQDEESSRMRAGLLS